MTRFIDKARTITIPTNVNVKVTAVYETAGKPSNSVAVNIPLNVNIALGTTPAQTKDVTYTFNVVSTPIQIPLVETIQTLAKNFFTASLDGYIDENRQLRTLVNFGNDEQVVVINQRYGVLDETNTNTLQLKLLRPLPDDVGLNDTAFISREIASTIIDNVRIKFAPEIDNTPYLRPANTSIALQKSEGKTLNKATLQLLGLQTGSVGGFAAANNISFDDLIMRKWYSYDFNSSELNIDFSNYSNFVFYGSANMRLHAFRQKLKKIEQLSQENLQFVGSVVTGSFNIPGRAAVTNRSADLAKQKEDIIRGFDRYEQHLYFTPSGSDSPYTASVSYTNTGDEYNVISYWPKDTNNNLYSVQSAEAQMWFDAQTAIAQRFDEFNENNLINVIPTHIIEDNNSSAYVTFVAMIGHLFDTIKIYVDQFPNIYDRQLNPDEGLSKDLIVDIANSVGFTLPSLNSLYSISDDILGATDETPRRDYTIQTYKRLLHNLPYFIKTKGTKTALNALFRSVGISDELINVREIGKSVTSSLYVFDEYSTGASFTGQENQYIKIPVDDTSRSPTQIQFSVLMTTPQNSTLMTGQTSTGNFDWALNIKKHPTNQNLGRFELVNGSGIILTSSYANFFDGNLTSVSLRTYYNNWFSKLDVLRTQDDNLIFSSSNQEPINSFIFSTDWEDTNFVLIGTGSFGQSNFDGIIDELRLWNINLSDNALINSAFDPSSNAGDDYNDAVDHLLVQLSFNKINTSLLPTALVNESPYENIAQSPSLQTIECSNITLATFDRYSRTIRQVLPQIGASGYVTKKINIAPPAVPTLDGNNTPTLSRTQSMVSVQQKRRNVQLGRSKIVIGTSPTEVINQNIIRTIGLQNINAALGSPTDLYKALGTSLQDLRTFYQTYYKIDVDINRYIRIVSAAHSVLNQVSDYFIPARASLVDGIVIEPNILEKPVLTPLTKFRVYGSTARRTLDAPSSLTGSSPDYTATFNLDQHIDTRDVLQEGGGYALYDKQHLPELANTQYLKTGSLPWPKSKIDAETKVNLATYNTYPTSSVINGIQVTNMPTGEYLTYDKQHLSITQAEEYLETGSALPWPKTRIDANTIDMNKIKFVSASALPPEQFRFTRQVTDGAEPFNRVYARNLFSYEKAPAGTDRLYPDALYEIFPSCDFRDIGAYTFFNRESGIYPKPTILYGPALNQELNISWDFENQTFPTAPTWTYGMSVGPRDVVYQDINTETYVRNLDADVVRAAKIGNRRYYAVRKNISTTFDAYTPPSLDRERWRVVKFVPYQVLVPRQFVFDIFRGNTPQENNFKITEASLDIDLVIPSRKTQTYEVPILASVLDVTDPDNPIVISNPTTGKFEVENFALLYAMQSSTTNMRVRLYRTANARNADIGRSIGQYPPGGAGLLLDTLITNANTTQFITPIVNLISGDIPLNGEIYYTIDNLGSAGSGTALLTLSYFGVDVQPAKPVGYLRKHYRFFRDNSTATKRRNFVGCKNTEDTTIDGLPVVQIFLSEGNETVVAAGADDIITKVFRNKGGILGINDTLG